MDLESMVAAMRYQSSDTAQVEAKRARDGFPESVAETISAFANTPGGGYVIFGLDQASGLSATGVYDVAKCQQAVASVARDGLDPPVMVTTEVVQFEGADLVVATVAELDRQVKPVRVRRNGKAYLRQYDGDYPLSDLEVQTFISQRGHPTFDQQPVSGATIDDLDATAVSLYLKERRVSSTVLAALSDQEVLRRTGVVDADSTTPTLAGLLALGIYPQQFMSNLGIQAANLDQSSGTSTTRVLDSAFLGGSIPAMLESAMIWVQRALPRAIIQDHSTGAVHDEVKYPLLAVRELIANALIHRELGPSGLSTPITLLIDPDQLLIANPGGLFGLRVEALGKTPSHSRNARLTEILQSVRASDGTRVVERLGSGIPNVLSALEQAKLPPPVFHDLGIRFVARLTGNTPPVPAPGKMAMAAATKSEHLPDTDLTANQRCVLAAVETKGSTVNQLAVATGLPTKRIRYALDQLEQLGRVKRSRQDGRTYRYDTDGSGG